MKSHFGKKSFSSFSTIVVFVLFCIIGIAILPYLSVQLFPSRTYASISVFSSLPEASAQTTEFELTSPIESVLARLKGVASISSYSTNGSCEVRIQLNKWVKPERFRLEASVVLRQLYYKLPSGATYPTIYLNHPDEYKKPRAIISFTLSGAGKPNELAQLAELKLRPEIAKIEGIHKFEITGARPSQIVIRPNLSMLNKLGMRMSDIQDVLSRGLRSRDIGVVTTQAGRSLVIIKKTLDDLEDLKVFPIKEYEGRIYSLSQLSTISEEEVESTSHYRVNGQEHVGLVFYAEEAANNIRLTYKIKQKLREAIKLHIPGYHINLQSDQTEPMKNELYKMYARTLLSVTILVILVVLFTRKVRYITIVLAAMAANVLLSSICFYILGLEIHLYSLAGITISLGLVLDNLIVIMEDIRCFRKKSIFSVILASTLTAIGALSTVFLLEDNLRINISDFAIAVIVMLTMSLPVAYILVPALLNIYPLHSKQNTGLFRRKRSLCIFSRLYNLQISFMLRYRVTLFLIFALAFGIPVFLLPDKIEEGGDLSKIYNSTIGSQFYNNYLREPINKYFGGILYYYISSIPANESMHNEDTIQEAQIYVRVSMPKGAVLEQMNAVCLEFEKLLGTYVRYIKIFTTLIESPISANIYIELEKNINPAIAHRLKKLLEQEAILSGSAEFTIQGVGKAFNNTSQLDLFESSFELRGYSYSQLQSIALMIVDSLKNRPRVSDIYVSPREMDPHLSYQNMIQFARSEYLSLHQISLARLSSVISDQGERSIFVGTMSSNKSSDLEKRIILHNYQLSDQGLWRFMHEPIKVTDSTTLRFANFSFLSRLRTGEQIVREGQEYVLYVNYKFIGTAKLNQLMRSHIIETMQPILPFGFQIVDMERKNRSQDQFNYLWYIPLTLLIIYMICAVLLESFKQAVAVIAMIPVSFIGVFLVFRILGLQFDQGGHAALLMLSGLVTNTALYIINDLNFLSTGKHDHEKAIRQYVKAFNAKTMPILITTITAIMSLLPFILSGEEKGFWLTLSAGTIGGALFSLLGSYLLLPLCVLKNSDSAYTSVRNHLNNYRAGGKRG